MAKKVGCPSGKVPYRGRCVKLGTGSVFLDNDKFRDNMYKITSIDHKREKIHGGYLSDEGWYSDPLREKIVARKTFSFDDFGDKPFERVT